MKNLILLFAVATLIASCSPSKSPEPRAGKAWFGEFRYSGNDAFFNENPLPDGKFYNPILSGFFPDPSICRKGNDYYLVNSTFSFFPGIPIFHSTDLVNWRQIGHVLDRPEQFINVDQPVSYGIFAPAIEYNPATDLFYVVTTYVGGGGNFVVTAKDPAGPWSNPIWLPEVPGIDPSLFFDDDGKAYLLNNQDPDYPPLYDGHKATWLQEFDVKTNTTFGPRKMIRDGGHNLAEKPIWIEGPHLHKLHGYYYLIPAEGGTGINHSQVVFRSKNVWGPYETWEGNPILTQRNLDKYRPNPVTNTGHADLIQDPGGDWYAVFLACRPYTPDNHFNIGRETFLLPVHWNDDLWPVILDPGLEVPMLVDLPKGAVNRDMEPGFMKRGNFSFIEDFSGKNVPMEWVFLRTPVDEWYSFESDYNGIWVEARPTNLRERKQPSFLGTRQRHHDFKAEISLTFLPASESELAGISLFQNEAFHYTLGVTLVNGKNHVVLQKAETKDGVIEKVILSSKALPASFKGNIELKAQCQKGAYSFWYKTGRSDWQLVKDNVDATYLSTERAQGFIGTILALYASSNE